jgi:hypothetical protein
MSNLNEKKDSLKDKSDKLIAKISAKVSNINKRKRKATDKLTQNKKKLNNKINDAEEKRNKTITFLLKVSAALVGYVALLKTTEKLINKTTSNLEATLKKGIIDVILNSLNCGNDTLIPNQYKSPIINPSSLGYKFKINKIDLLNLLYVDPESEEGRFFYYDNNSSLNSRDFNVVLFNVLQSNTISNYNINNKNILKLQYNEQQSELIIYVGDDYSNGTIKKFIEDFINAIDIIDDVNIISNIFNEIFGSINNILNKTKNILIQEEKVNYILEKFIDSEENFFDNSFFDFDILDIENINNTVGNKRKSVLKLESCDAVIIPNQNEDLIDFYKQYDNTINVTEKIILTSNILNKTLENISQATEEDKDTFRVNFLILIIRKFMLVILKSFLSPKTILLLNLSLKMTNDFYNEPENIIEYIEKNSSIIRDLKDEIKSKVIQFLISQVVSELKTVIIQNKILESKETAENISLQLSSLSRLNIFSNNIPNLFDV